MTTTMTMTTRTTPHVLGVDGRVAPLDNLAREAVERVGIKPVKWQAVGQSWPPPAATARRVTHAWLSVVISYSTQPSAQMSDLWLYGLFLKISGDM